MSVQSQQKNMKNIYSLLFQNPGYIYGERESGPNGAKKQFHIKTKIFLRALGRDLGFQAFKVTNSYGGTAVSGEITLMGMWEEENGLYLQISQPVAGRRAFLYRHISHMKDYTGGRNQWISINIFADGKYAELADALPALRKTAGEASGYAA